MRKMKKSIKKRFSVEVNPETKLFFLSGIKNDYYLKRDVMNLARYISIIKCKPVAWKTNHPYMLADRFENKHVGNFTDEDLCTISFYGYIRGSSYRVSEKIHLLGLGDY